MCTRQTHLPLLIGLLRCFEFASLVHDEFLHLHVLLKYSLCLLRLLFESSIYFIQHEWRCSYTVRERLLIESGVWSSGYGMYICVTSHQLIKYVLIIMSCNWNHVADLPAALYWLVEYTTPCASTWKFLWKFVISSLCVKPTHYRFWKFGCGLHVVRSIKLFIYNHTCEGLTAHIHCCHALYVY